jgi:4'-phosphopantetheinyl transferase EntD
MSPDSPSAARPEVVPPAARVPDAPLYERLPDAIIVHTDVPDVADYGWDQLYRQRVDDGRLHPGEVSLARELPPNRRATFVAGRTAVRWAMQQATGLPSPLAAPAVLRTARGAPLLPDALAGSITHKRRRAAAAIATRRGPLVHLGLDLERRPVRADLDKPSIARRILTPRELVALEPFADDALRHRTLTLVHFAMKEAVYKAVDPFVHRYVRFTEVELSLTLDSAAERGHADVTLHLPELAHGRVRAYAQWHMDAEWIVATAYTEQR